MINEPVLSEAFADSHSCHYSTEMLGQEQTNLQVFWSCISVPEVTDYKGSNICFEDVCLSMP